MRRLQLAGHRPLALVGGATGLIGDPKPTSASASLNARRGRRRLGRRASGRRSSRSSTSTGRQRRGHGQQPRLDGADCRRIEFLRDVGKHFRVNQMLDQGGGRAPGSSRRGHLLHRVQLPAAAGLDFLELYRRHGCTLQIGGSDQWGNITAGLDLIRRVEGGRVARARRRRWSPRPTARSSARPSRGAVWLDPELTSPYAFYQFWLNADDRDVRGLPADVHLPPPRARSRRSRQSPRERPQPARPSGRWPRSSPPSCTARPSGARVEAAAARAVRPGRAGRPRPGDARRRARARRRTPPCAAERPTASRSPTCSRAPGWWPRRSAARRAVEEGGAYLNNVRVDDADARRSATQDLLHGRWLVLRRGRRTSAASIDAAERRPDGTARASDPCGATSRSASRVPRFDLAPRAPYCSHVSPPGSNGHRRGGRSRRATHAGLRPRAARRGRPRVAHGRAGRGRGADLTARAGSAKLERVAPRTAEGLVSGARPLLENSTACRKSMPNNPVPGVGGGPFGPCAPSDGIPLV